MTSLRSEERGEHIETMDSFSSKLVYEAPPTVLSADEKHIFNSNWTEINLSECQRSVTSSNLIHPVLSCLGLLEPIPATAMCVTENINRK